MEVFEVKEKEYERSLQADDGDIKNYQLTEKTYYPSIFFSVPMGDISFYQMIALKNAIEETKFNMDELPEDYYGVYVLHEGDKALLGMIKSDRMRRILENEIYKGFDKVIYLSENEKIEGDMMYALCTNPLY